MSNEDAHDLEDLKQQVDKIERDEQAKSEDLARMMERGEL